MTYGFQIRHSNHLATLPPWYNNNNNDNDNDNDNDNNNNVNDNDNDIYPGSPLTLVVFIGALQIIIIK